LQLHFDSNIASIGENFQKKPGGSIVARVPVSKSGVFPYADPDRGIRLELRHPKLVFTEKSLQSLGVAPVTLEHPPELITPDNYSTYNVGGSGNKVSLTSGIEPLIEVVLGIHDRKAIESIESGKTRELSPGYKTPVDDVSSLIQYLKKHDSLPLEGIEIRGDSAYYNGRRFTHIQRNPEYNHIAITRKARGGSEICFNLDSLDLGSEPYWVYDPGGFERFDSKAQIYDLGEKMTTQYQVNLNGIPYVVADRDLVKAVNELQVKADMADAMTSKKKKAMVEEEEMMSDDEEMTQDMMDVKKRKDMATTKRYDAKKKKPMPEMEEEGEMEDEEEIMDSDLEASLQALQEENVLLKARIDAADLNDEESEEDSEDESEDEENFDSLDDVIRTWEAGRSILKIKLDAGELNLAESSVADMQRIVVAASDRFGTRMDSYNDDQIAVAFDLITKDQEVVPAPTQRFDSRAAVSNAVTRTDGGCGDGMPAKKKSRNKNLIVPALNSNED
jgi:hypothetical protein